MQQAILSKQLTLGVTMKAIATPMLLLAGLACTSTWAYATEHHHAGKNDLWKGANKPAVPQNLPPSLEQSQFDLHPARLNRNDLITKTSKSSASKLMSAPPTADCQDMNKLASYSGAALADYIVNLPSFECHYGLFSLGATQAAKVFSAANMQAVATRLSSEANNYNASNMAVVNLVLYVRAAYYLASGGTIATPDRAILTGLRVPLKKLIDGNSLYQNNSAGPTTASEVFKLVTNLSDEAYYLPSVKALVERFTNTSARPDAVSGLKNSSAADGFTGALTVFFYAHYRSDATPLLQADLSYATALNNFVVNNKAALLGSQWAYQLKDTENEAFRFMQYASLKNGIKPMLKYQLANSSMTGSDSDLWLGAASAVKYYDSANCAEYGTCNYETKLADTVLKTSYVCSPTIKIRAQDMTAAQLADSCNALSAEENYVHTMLQTKRQPVAGDNNTSLEVVVFDDYANYSKYASVIYGIDTNNGGMYLEGDPAQAGNQARFIAHEASWLRPQFKIWNLEHEYVHYLDGRFDMRGDFSAGTAKPTVWWIEGVAEYLSLRNNNQAAIDAAKKGTYKLSQIFANTYSMNDYVERAYRWGYMATRFMVEKHRSDVDAILAKFRAGDYDGYQNYMNYIGTRYDNEFTSWVASATTAGEPPLPSDPVVNLPDCGTYYLGKNCSIKNLASTSQTYGFLMLPANAKNVRIFTSGGTGDVDLYLALERYPSSSSYDQASVNSGNSESISLSNPQANRWYYITLKAKSAFSGVTLSATYD